MQQPPGPRPASPLQSCGSACGRSSTMQLGPPPDRGSAVPGRRRRGQLRGEHRKQVFLASHGAGFYQTPSRASSRPDRTALTNSLVVPLVLVGVPLREVGDRLVERVAVAQVGGDGDRVPGPGVRPGQRPPAGARVERERDRRSSPRAAPSPSCRAAGASRSGGARPPPWSSRGRCRWRPASSAAPAPPARRAAGSGSCAT